MEVPVPVVVEKDNVVESLNNVIVEGIESEKYGRAQLENLHQELQMELVQKQTLLIEHQKPSLMKETDEERHQQLEHALKREEIGGYERVTQLRNLQLHSIMEVTTGMKSMLENYKNAFQEYSNSNIERHMPELEERARRLEVEAEAARGEYERLRDSYLRLETSTGDEHRGLALLNNTTSGGERAGRVQAMQLELQRLWYFAPTTSRLPRLLHDTPQRSATKSPLVTRAVTPPPRSSSLHEIISG